MKVLVNSLILISLVILQPMIFAIPPTSPKVEKLEPRIAFSVGGIWESDAGSVCKITKIEDVYLVEWSNGDAGLGSWRGNKTFVVAFNNSKIRAGLAIYQLELEDKIYKLKGEWSAVPGNGKWATETLIKIK